MDDQVRVEDVMLVDLDTIDPETDVRTARRRMESQTRRSLIVVENGMPLGIVEWRDIMPGTDVPEDAAVRDHMDTDFPAVRPDMPVLEARRHIGEVDVDRIPVVNESGRLVGEIQRTQLSHPDVVTDEAPLAGSARSTSRSRSTTVGTGAPLLTDDPDDLKEKTHMKEGTLREGMKVVSSDAIELGQVDEIVLERNGEPSEIVVAHGMIGKDYKQLPVSSIDRIEDGGIVLDIDHNTWDQLGNLGDRS